MKAGRGNFGSPPVQGKEVNQHDHQSRGVVPIGTGLPQPGRVRRNGRDGALPGKRGRSPARRSQRTKGILLNKGVNNLGQQDLQTSRRSAAVGRPGDRRRGILHLHHAPIRMGPAAVQIKLLAATAKPPRGPDRPGPVRPKKQARNRRIQCPGQTKEIRPRPGGLNNKTRRKSP